MRYITPCVGPSPNGPAPVTAKASTQPSANTSVAGPTGRFPVSCSGAMKAGVPTATPVVVSALASFVTEMPKSMTRGPFSASSTFDGFRSRCTTPAR